MELAGGKSGMFRNILLRFLLFSVIVITIRFAYVITIRGESCIAGDDFCFFSSSVSPENENLVTGRFSSSSFKFNPTAETSPEFNKRMLFYTSVFQNLITDGFLSTKSKSLCIETPSGEDVHALRELNVDDSIGIYKKPFEPFVIKGSPFRHPFDDNTFDFTFSGNGALARSEKPADFASEIVRTLKPEGYLVVHIASLDSYSFNSLIRLFNSCTFIRSRQIDGFESFEGDKVRIHEIVMQKRIEIKDLKTTESTDSNSVNQCSVPGYKQELINKAEPLIQIEPMKPWITLKKNLENVKYLPSMADISFKRRYVYVDVGSRSYGSSIVSWFKKQYPKQNKTFDIYAIEADKRFHDQYKSKKGVTLMPYAAWVKNESLVFEINQTPGDGSNGLNGSNGSDPGVGTRGMGRIRPGKGGSGNVVQGFDFAEWLKETVNEDDFVVVKMDVEGAEFELIPRLVETGAICLVDEVFLECHYNRWQRCCPGVRSPKYEKSYGQCLELFESLRRRGVLVHQWW